tara:strand:+ start:1832 stop:2959 length:1128 start_codon:yes stop_codon:yes gene_type:complete
MKTLNWIQKRIFPTIIALSALSVSASAAFYSVTGLSKLFAGASFQVLIMTGSLEVAKLVIASLLYQYWSQLNKILRAYLSIASVILILITSAGIYGFLSAAYQETASKSGIIDKEVELLDLKKSRFEENRTYYLTEKKELDGSISDLRSGLSNNQIQYRDKVSGQIINTTSSAQRKSLEKQLESAVNTRESISKKIEVATDSISSLEIKVLNIESNSEVASELGPLKYISELTNTPMNRVVNILMLVIIFVFDPLAIALVIAANFAFGRLRKKDDEDTNIVDSESDIEKQIRDIEIRDMYKPSDEELAMIQSILEKLEPQSEVEVENLENEVKLTEELPQEDDISVVNEEPNVPQIKKLIYQRRDANRNTRIDRI